MPLLQCLGLYILSAFIVLGTNSLTQQTSLVTTDFQVSRG